MTLLLIAAVLGLGFGWVSRGTLRGLEAVQVRFGGAMIAAVCLMGILPALPLALWIQDPEVLVWVVWMPLAASACTTALLNRRIMGMGLVATGVLMNMLVVAANAGMPVVTANLPSDAAAASVVAIERSWLHVAAHASTRFLILADVVPIPGPQGLRGMASIGDALLALGVAVALTAMMHAGNSDDLSYLTAEDDVASQSL